MAEDADFVTALKNGLGISYSGKETTKDLDRNYRQIHDHVRTKDSSPRSPVLSKMQAEAALCTNLTCCSFMFLLAFVGFHIIAGFSQPSLHYTMQHSLEGATVLAIIFLAGWAAYDRNEKLLERHLIVLRRLVTSDSENAKGAGA